MAAAALATGPAQSCLRKPGAPPLEPKADRICGQDRGENWSIERGCQRVQVLVSPDTNTKSAVCAVVAPCYHRVITLPERCQRIAPGGRTLDSGRGYRFNGMKVLQRVTRTENRNGRLPAPQCRLPRRIITAHAQRSPHQPQKRRTPRPTKRAAAFMPCQAAEAAHRGHQREYHKVSNLPPAPACAQTPLPPPGCPAHEPRPSASRYRSTRHSSSPSPPPSTSTHR